MGSFIGHSATGTGFWILGLFYLVRALGLRMFDSFRWSNFWLTLPGLGQGIGGICYAVGEWYRQAEFGMANVQHYEMASTMALAGFTQVLHQRGYLRGIGWAFVAPALWLLMGLLFVFHPQHGDEYAAFGHVVMAYMFLMVTFCQSIELMVGFFCSNPRRESQYGPILAMYKNPKSYGTPFPLLGGVILMIIGSVDWDMAINFWSNTKTGTLMQAEMSFVGHTLVNILIAIVVCLLLQKADSIYASRCMDRGALPQWLGSDERLWTYGTTAKEDDQVELREV